MSVRHSAVAVLVCAALMPRVGQSAASPMLERDAAKCLAHARIDVCNDAIRRSPSDPALLVALADAEIRAKRPADALRHYRRAAELAPAQRGLTAKISAADALVHPPRSVTATRRATPGTPQATAVANKPYSNAAPMAESH